MIQDFQVLMMDGANEISMSEVDAVEAVVADPKRYTYAMADVRDALKNETLPMRKLEALKRISDEPARFSMMDKKAPPLKVVPQK